MEMMQLMQLMQVMQVMQLMQLMQLPRSRSCSRAAFADTSIDCSQSRA